MAQDNRLWNSLKTAINIPLMKDVGKTVGIKANTKGIGGYELTMRTEESITLANSITDYYAEDNSSLQDNIALQPLTFTINGIVGEKYMDVTELSSASEAIMNKLGPVLPYLPDCTSFVLQTLTVAEAIASQARSALEEASETVNKLFGFTGGDEENQTTISNQEQAFLFFYSAYKARELFEVNLPWATLNNCAIESVTITQPAETRWYSSVEIQFKQMNFASTQSSASAGRIGRSAAQATPTPATNLSNIGTSTNGGTSTAGFEARAIN